MEYINRQRAIAGHKMLTDVLIASDKLASCIITTWNAGKYVIAINTLADLAFSTIENHTLQAQNGLKSRITIANSFKRGVCNTYFLHSKDYSSVCIANYPTDDKNSNATAHKITSDSLSVTMIVCYLRS